MSSFTTELDVRQIRGTKSWELLDEFTYWIGHEESGVHVDLDPGFITDFASIPSPFWPIIGHPAGPHVAAAALVHDWGYRKHTYKIAHLDSEDLTLSASRRQWDRVFFEATGVLGMSLWKRSVMWAVLRVFGGIAWTQIPEAIVPPTLPEVIASV